MNGRLLPLLTLLLFVPVSGGEEPFQDDPQQLCSLARELGFGGATSYRRQVGGEWLCASTRRTLIEGEPAATSDVRYLVVGGEQRAQRLRLELRMRSYRAPQGVLNRFFRYVEKLLNEILKQEPPSGLREAILSPVEGEWLVGQYRMKLKKMFQKGSSYDLWFIVEPLPEAGQSHKENKE